MAAGKQDEHVYEFDTGVIMKEIHTGRKPYTRNPKP